MRCRKLQIAVSVSRAGLNKDQHLGAGLANYDCRKATTEWIAVFITIRLAVHSERPNRIADLKTGDAFTALPSDGCDSKSRKLDA